jgi:hypothetical protein
MYCAWAECLSGRRGGDGERGSSSSSSSSSNSAAADLDRRTVTSYMAIRHPLRAL